MLVDLVYKVLLCISKLVSLSSVSHSPVSNFVFQNDVEKEIYVKMVTRTKGANITAEDYH
jgi:hypothetical protein